MCVYTAQLKLEVEANHVKEAARLIRTATYQALTDPYTGRIDFEQLHVVRRQLSVHVI